MNPRDLPRSGDWIYLILNSANDKVYVGKTRRMYQRCHQYIYSFREHRRNHINEHLFNAMCKHGIESFEMVPLELCENAEHAVDRELFWMDWFNSTNRRHGYNLRRDSRRGMITHPETSTKIRSNLIRQHAAGLRSDHSRKLKASWNGNVKRRSTQAGIMRKNLTKYIYLVDGTSHDYRGLVSLGLASVLSSFHRSGTNAVTLKGHAVQRVPVCQN